MQQVGAHAPCSQSRWPRVPSRWPPRVGRPLGKAAGREILGRAGLVRRRAQAMRAAALPTPSLFFPGFNRDPMIKFPLPGVGSSCAQTPSAAEGDEVFAGVR